MKEITVTKRISEHIKLTAELSNLRIEGKTVKADLVVRKILNNASSLKRWVFDVRGEGLTVQNVTFIDAYADTHYIDDIATLKEIASTQNLWNEVKKIAMSLLIKHFEISSELYKEFIEKE